MPDWTAEQAAAIAARDRRIVCAAAAGSGKTAVLAERVAGLLSDPAGPASIDQLLVLTFTRSAAAEMRRRIAVRLRERAGEPGGPGPWLQRQAVLLPQAAIGTIHGFCDRVLRRWFGPASLDPEYRILEPSEAAELLDGCLDELLEARYAGRDAGGAAWVDAVERYGGSRLDEDLRGLVRRLYHYAQSLEDPEGWLAAQARRAAAPDPDAAGAAAGRALRRLEGRVRRTCLLAARPGGPGAYAPALEADEAVVEGLGGALAQGGWDALAQALQAAAFRRLPPVEDEAERVLAERVRSMRDRTKEEVRRLAAGPFGRGMEAHRAEARLVAGHLRPVVDLARDLGQAYGVAKRAQNAVDFDDLEHRTLALLRDTAVAPAAGDFREVLVDEAQDLSPVQDALLSALCGPARLFCVGDARQSIYGFRLAEPRRFLARAAAAEPAGPPAEGAGAAAHAAPAAAGSVGPGARAAPEAARRIALPHNFRSRRAIIGAVNLLFGALLTARGSDLPPAEAGALQYAAALPGEDPPVELHLLEGGDAEAEGDDGDEQGAPGPGGTAEAGGPEAAPAGGVAEGAAGAPPLTPLEREAAAAAGIVARWLREGSVTEGGAARAPRPGDVAILLRAAAGVQEAYVDAVRAAGVPCAAPAGGGHLASAEGRAVLAWLQVLDNPQQDLPLAAVLRGPFGGFADADLARWRLEGGAGGDLWSCLQAARRRGEAGAAAWMERLDRWRTEARRAAFGRLLSEALEDSGYAARVAGLPDGARRLATFDWLLERFRRAEEQPGMDAARLADTLRRGDGGETASEAALAAGDVVRVLTVHAAKGLEFPFVVVAGLGRRMSLRDRQGDVLVHREAGLGARLVDLDRRVKWPTLGHAAVAERIEADARAEEARVLYVALTRARERLALVGRVRRLVERAAEWRAAAGADPDLGDGSSPLEWFGPLLARHPDVEAALARLSGDAPRAAHADGEPHHRWRVVLEGGAAGAGSPAAPGATTGEVAAAAAPPGRGGGANPAGEDGEDEASVLRRLDAEDAWRYPFAAATRLAAKATVGELAERAAAEGALGDEEAAEALAAPDDGPGPPPAGRRPAHPAGFGRPRFASGREPTPSEVGTATHLLMRHLDLAGPCDEAAAAACLVALQDREMLEPNAARAVDAAAVAAFLTSPLGLRLRRAAAAGALRREVPFSLRLDPRAAAGAGGEAAGAAREWVLVQGVVDALALEPDGIVVVDYKTDRVTGEADLAALPARYGAQVGLYARAAAGAYGRPVREAWLAFLSAGRQVPVPVPQTGSG